MQKLLVFNKNTASLRELYRLITSLNYSCTAVDSYYNVLSVLSEEQPDIILANDCFSNGELLEFLQGAKNFHTNTPIILFSENVSVDRVVTAIKNGASDYLSKPITLLKLQCVLSNYLKNSEPTTNNSKLPKEVIHLEHVVGKSKVMQKIAKLVYKVAKSDANVMIYGETGTGKELIAHSIHKYSSRYNGPFIPLDCVAIPQGLVESEIFGYEKGAFTGAEHSKPGLLELANGGTFFLDEITELDIYLQAKLLRVLQEREFRKIGGKSITNVDVRIISATNYNPEKAVENNKLRRDLYYRLNVIRIDLPPLRERKEDIPVLVDTFIRQLNPIIPHKIKGIDNGAMECLKLYDWPGNIRELKNVIEQSMSLSEGPMITIKDLPDNIVDNIQLFKVVNQSLSFKEAREQYYRQFCKRYFGKLFEKHNGNISQVAKEAKLSRATIYRIIQEYHFRV